MTLVQRLHSIITGKCRDALLEQGRKAAQITQEYR
jgi:hypothetical protein